jgi:hypothetical protein
MDHCSDWLLSVSETVVLKKSRDSQPGVFGLITIRLWPTQQTAGQIILRCPEPDSAALPWAADP